MAYASRQGPVLALEGVSFGVGEGEFVCIVGPSGCGKTTLLKLIAGLLVPSAGEVTFAGGPVDHVPRTALVFQEHGLFPWLTVLDNAAFGLEAQGVAQGERRRRALAFIERLGLGPFAHSLPHELSVGMAQRVGIARAFIAGAPILLMDEPFAALDAQTRLVLREELLAVWQEQYKTVVYVTHDVEEAILLGDRVLVMSGRPGRIRAEVPIDLGRPRAEAGERQAQVAELKWHIWKMLESEVRRGLQVAG